MDSSPAQNGGDEKRREKRDRKDPVNRIARAKAARHPGEKVNPVPHNIMGPVPSVKEQTAALMQDPGWLLAEMRRRESLDEPQTGPVDDFADFDLDMDDDEILTGYEVVQMHPFHADSGGRMPEPVQGSTGSEATEPPLEEPPETAAAGNGG